MSKFHLGWFLGPGITIQGWNEPGFAPGYDWTKPDIFVDAARALAEVLKPTTKPLDIQVTATDGGLDIDVRGSGPLPTAMIELSET